MAKLKSELSWSFSRDRLFKECQRAYYYHYYASWGGWESNADNLTKKAYLLKNIRNIDAWIGDIVHQIIKWILENKIHGSGDLFTTKGDISYQDAADKAKQILLKTWEQSRDQLWKKNIKHNLNLFEHYYGPEPTREELTSKLQKVTKSIKNFYSSGLLEHIANISQENFLKIDELDTFEFEGVKVFAVPDFALLNENYFLYDWKTGKKHDNDILQLSCYALYALVKWNTKPEKIKVIPVYLTQDNLVLSPIDYIETDKVKEYIHNSLSQMKSILSSLEQNQADITLCQKTENLRRCQRCKFQEICS
jgi:hypothetical protein